MEDRNAIIMMWGHEMIKILFSGSFMYIIILYGCYIVGFLLARCLKRKIGIINAIVTGFVSFTALFEVLFLFAVLLKFQFSVLVSVFGSFAAVLICVGTVIFIKNIKINKQNREIKNIKHKYFYIGTIILLVGMQMFLSGYLEHMDDDDGYFITISNIALEEDIICLDSNRVYDGIIDTDSFRPWSASWEIFLAFFAKLFQIHPAILAHTIIPPLLILLCYMAVYDLGRRIIHSQKILYLFLIIYAILNLFGGYTVYSSACFLLLRIWQGKAMLVNFAFPMLIGNCIDIYKEKEKMGTWIINFIIVVSGIGFTVVGLYLMPIYYVVIGMPYLIYCGVGKKWKRLRKLVIGAVISMLPVIFYILHALYGVVSSDAGREYMLSDAPDWKSIYDMTMGQGAYFVLYLMSISYMLIRKSSKSVPKILFCGIFMCSFLTFLNPFFCEFVSKKITGVDVYWRLYWLLPIYLSIAYVFSELLGELNGLRRFAGLIMMCIIIYAGGGYIYQKDLSWEHFKNVYKLPEEGICVAEELLGKKEYTSCIFPEDLSPKIRQYSSKITVIKARGMSGSDKYGWLYGRIYNECIIDEDVKAELRNLGVDYIYSRSILQSNFIKDISVIKGYGYLYYLGN